jgi:aspartyl-tRNA(Asn)/glutamyl-tRNA(Gln) amidotransferase subunit C
VSVSFDDVRHIAALARVGIDERRLPALASELSGILEHMAVLTRVETSTVEIPAAATDVPLRVDAGPPIPLARPLPAFAPMMRDGFLIVPRLATHGGEGPGRASESSGDDRPDDEDSE